MENASNALLIAAGVLIGVLVLSLAVYLVVDFGGISAEVHQDIDSRRLAEFNTKFDVYVTNAKERTIQDVATVAGFARENNNYYKDNSGNTPDEYNITVKIDSNFIIDNKAGERHHDTDSLTLIKMYPDDPNDSTKNKFSCSVHNNANGRVDLVIFNS